MILDFRSLNQEFRFFLPSAIKNR